MNKSNTNFVDDANNAVAEFVELPKNKRLLPGTGSFSTPFRGTLFGESSSEAICNKLLENNVDAIWMGSNPNVPQSLESILNNPRISLYESFQMQIKSGKYSEQSFTQGRPLSVGWDPINKPSNNGWNFYNQAFKKMLKLDRIAMANYVVWGSKNFELFLKEMSQFDSQLLDRILNFSAQLNQNIIKSLKPKLILVPLSLGRNKFLENLSTASLFLNLDNVEHVNVPIGQRQFNFYIHEAPKDFMDSKIVYVPHPSAIRLNKANGDLDRVNDAIASKLL